MTLVYTSIVLFYLVGILGLILYPRLQGSIRLLVLYAFFSGSMDVMGSFVAHHSGNNHIFFNICLLADFLIMLFALKDFMGRHFKWIALIEISVFVTSYLMEWRINGIAYFMRHTIITYMAMMAINNLTILGRTLNVPELRKPGVYIISIAGLIYYCCVIPRFGLFKSISTDRQLSNIFNQIGVAVDMMRFVAIAAALVTFARSRRQPKTRPAVTAGS